MTPDKIDLHWFAACAPGFEPFLAGELRARVPDPDTVRPLPGGVEFDGGMEAGFRANLEIRSGNRILLRIGRFYATGFPELLRKAERLNWEAFLTPDRPVDFRVTCRKSRLYHSGAVAERMLRAVSQRVGFTPRLIPFDEDADDPSQLIVIRLFRDQCLISLDASGAGLHRRGYRLETGKAPLREDLAAAVLLASGWDRRSALIDPFCGSGTIAIEAALMAAGIPPGRKRKFAFMRWPDYEPNRFEPIREEIVEPETDDMQIIAADRDAGAIRIARENAARAGVADRIHFVRQSISDLISPECRGWIVTNPPYGRRVRSHRDLRDLYARTGRILHERFSGWQVTLLTADRGLLRQTGIRFDASLFFDHGGVKVTAARGKIP